MTLQEIETPTSGGVYFLLSTSPGGDTAIKIGYSRSNIAGRLVSLRTAHPWPLRLVAFIAGAPVSVEREHHRLFAACTIAGSPGREWFHLTSGLHDYLERLQCSFNAWLAQQVGRDDMVGDLADDNVREPLAPVRCFDDLRSAIRSVTWHRGVREAAAHAWYEFRKGRPSPMIREQQEELDRNIAPSTAPRGVCVHTKYGMFMNGRRLFA